MRAHVLFTLCVCSGVQHILCCVLFFFVLCTLCCQFLWSVHFFLPLRYSLMFIYTRPTCFQSVSTLKPHFINRDIVPPYYILATTRQSLFLLAHYINQWCVLSGQVPQQCLLSFVWLDRSSNTRSTTLSGITVAIYWWKIFN
jgi:hypothetical protein